MNETKNYKMFNFLKVNRKVDKESLHYKRLRKAIQKTNTIIPIIVNDDYDVIDGQHRLTIAEELNMPIPFIILNNHKEMEKSSLIKYIQDGHEGWSVDDIFNMQINLGNPIYIEVSNLANDYGISIINMVNLVSFNRTKEVLSSGRLTLIPNYKEYIKIWQDFSFFNDYKSVRFIGGLRMLLNKRNYRHDKMLAKLEYLQRRFVKCFSGHEYYEMFREIYNLKLNKENQI